jgi:hypothetical protein
MTDKKGRLRIDDKGIGAVLKASVPLTVPPNQREYSWNEEHVTDLFQDLQKAIDNNTPTYFLGAIALTGDDPNRPEVTDGQQRLATTTMLLAAMRDYFCEHKETFNAQWLESEYLLYPDPEEQRNVPRLTLNVDDRQFFASQIINRPGDPARDEKPQRQSHKRIAAAFKLAREQVEKITNSYTKQSEKISRLRRWIEFISNDALVIVLELPSDLNAFQMFETLNDRGLRTTQLDIVKNYLFREAQENITAVQMKWSQMMSILETLDGDEVPLTFIRHFIITKSGTTRAGEVYEKVEGMVAGKHRAVEFVDEMEGNASDYAAIVSPDHKKWNTYDGYATGVRNSIRTMQYLKVVNTRPLMLAVARHFSPEDADRAFRLFVNWTVRFLIVGGGRSGTLEEHYSLAAQEVASTKIKDTHSLAAKLSSIVPIDASFKQAFATATVSKRSLARYYLRALELKHKGDPEPEWVPNDDASDVNLEHVLPERPGTNYPIIPLDLAAALYPRIGNLALLQNTKNNDLGNKAFGDKKPILQQSTFVLTSQIADYGDWGLNEINDRQNKLADLAVKTWPLTVS